MSTRVPEKASCPCCGERRFVGAGRSPQTNEEELTRRGGMPGWGRPGWSVELARVALLVWACADCVESGRADRAKPWLQEYCRDSPRFAYFAIEKICRSCGDPFVFSKEEQRRWYEDFKLPPSAEPVDCRSCRSVKKAQKEASSRLGPALKDLDPRNPEELTKIAALYLIIDRPRKAAEFLRRAKNASAEPETVGKLMEQIVELERGQLPRELDLYRNPI